MTPEQWARELDAGRVIKWSDQKKVATLIRELAEDAERLDWLALYDTSDWSAVMAQGTGLAPNVRAAIDEVRHD